MSKSCISSILERDFINQLEFSQNSIFAYIANLDKCEKNVAQFWECLSTEEQIQAKKYHASSLSYKYIISHGILRHILSYYTQKPPQCIEFIHNKYGKPFLRDSNIQFNMSHSYNIASYVVSLNYRVGIDIEMHDNTLDVQELAYLILTSQEYDFFTTLKIDEKLKFFYHTWTKKESLIKANGQGLTYPINTIETLSLSPGDKIFLTRTENQHKQVWYHFPLEFMPNYSGAIATEHKVHQITYVEIDSQKDIFNKIKTQHFTNHNKN